MFSVEMHRILQSPESLLAGAGTKLIKQLVICESMETAEYWAQRFADSQSVEFTFKIFDINHKELTSYAGVIAPNKFG